MQVALAERWDKLKLELEALGCAASWQHDELLVDMPKDPDKQEAARKLMMQWWMQ